MPIGGNLGTLVVSVGTDLTQLNTGLNTAVNRVNRSANRIAASAARVGRSMQVLGAAVTGFFLVAAKGAGDFSQELANVITLVDDVDGQIRTKFTKGIEDLAKTYGESTTSLAKSLFDIQSATGDSGAALTRLESATRLAIAGNSNLVASTSGLLTLMESYGDVLKGSADGADLLFKAQEKARANVGQLAASAGDFIPIARQLNIDVDELLGTYAQLTVALGNTNESATALNGIIRTFLKPTEELKALVKEWGFESAQAALEQEGLLNILKRLSLEEKETLPKLFQRIEGLKGLAAVLSNLEKVEENIADIRDREGAVTKALEIQMKEFNRQVAISRENVAALFRDIGQLLIPSYNRLLTMVRLAANELSEWIKNNQESAKEVAINAAKIGALSIALGTILMLLPGIVGGLTLMSSTLAFMVANPLVAAIISIVVFKDKIIDFVENGLKAMVNMLNEVAAKSAVLAAVFNPIREILLDIIIGLEATGEAVEINIGERLSTAFQNAKDKMVDFYEESSRLADELTKRVIFGETEKERVKDTLDKQDTTRKKKKTRIEGEVLEQRLGQISSFLAQAGEENRGAAVASKAIATGMAIVHTAVGIVRALAEYTWPYSLIVAALVGAAGAVEIASINSVGFQTGTDSVPAMLTPGEMVFPRTMSDAIRSGDIVVSGGKNGGAGQTTIGDININIDAQVANEVDMEELTEMIGSRIESELRRV